MRKIIVCSVVMMLTVIAGIKTAYCQDKMAAVYQRAADLCEEAAKKYDAKGCTASAAYCRKIKQWNLCMVSALAGKPNSCGIEPPLGNAPKCDAATIGGTSGSSTGTSNDPIKEMQLKQQQEINGAQNAATAAFDNSINSGKKTSGALVDATLAGAQNFSDPKMQLAYSGTGLAVAGLVALSERKEARLEARQAELNKLKESLATSSTILNFASGITSYHITNLRVIKKSNGRIKSVIRTNRYDIYVDISSIKNTADSITIFESVSFKNLLTSNDSTVIHKIVFALADFTEATAYSGNYTNSYNYSSDSYANYRYKELDNSSIEHAFTMQGDFPQLPSGLKDVYITAKYNSIKVYTKYGPGHSSYLNNNDFNDAYVHNTDSYLLVFDNTQTRVTDFVDYLNALK